MTDTTFSPELREQLKQTIVAAFAERGQTVDTEFTDRIIADLQQQLPGVVAGSPKTFAQELIGNLGAAAEAAAERDAARRR